MRSMPIDRLKELFPETDPQYFRREAILVPHPMLDKKFSQVLLPASDPIEAMFIEARDEMHGIVSQLGAKETEFMAGANTSQERETDFNASGNYKVASAKVNVNSKNKKKGSKTERNKITGEGFKIAETALNDLEKELFYHKKNSSLQALLRKLKKGEKLDIFELHFEVTHTLEDSFAASIEVGVKLVGGAKAVLSEKLKASKSASWTVRLKFT